LKSTNGIGDPQLKSWGGARKIKENVGGDFNSGGELN